ncbi:hypothetical protein I553_3543 [Mycobacterium xenopi 4042]|uniref:Uncharacterized protein n=1 Tax=Mycobacterium xenopi 4042 TaxID=1299334 RepID=X8ALR1_MYCXE|nr:hypothetical protein I553_3543 [Mycobacterium xenopi 4042]
MARRRRGGRREHLVGDHVDAERATTLVKIVVPRSVKR